MTPSFSRGAGLLAAQLTLIGVGVGAVALAPPTEGTMLLIPMAASARPAVLAVSAGALIVGRGRWPGSVVVRGRADRLVGPLLARHVLTLAAPAVMCGDPA